MPAAAIDDYLTQWQYGGEQAHGRPALWSTGSRYVIRLVKCLPEQAARNLHPPYTTHQSSHAWELRPFELRLFRCRRLTAAGRARRPVAPHAFPLIGYGLTETNSVGRCNLNENYLAKPGSTGPASRPLVEVAVLGPDGAPQPPGLRGEIAIRSVCTFREYWRNPEETAAAIRDDGFFLTGDLGYQDEAGYLFIVDRKKDIIIRGGENIASLEVEHAIYAHPGVAEASVFGLPHAHYGEVPVAVFAARDGHSLNENELREHLAERIAAFKIPVRLWRENSSLPRLGTQKIDKRSLKARYLRQWDDAKDAG